MNGESVRPSSIKSKLRPAFELGPPTGFEEIDVANRPERSDIIVCVLSAGICRLLRMCLYSFVLAVQLCHILLL